MRNLRLLPAFAAVASIASSSMLVDKAMAQAVTNPPALPVGAALLPFGISAKNFPVPEPDNLRAFLKADTPAARTAMKQLGKALFWDVFVSSDDVTACATCHFNAGADSRSKNQLEPGSHADWVTAPLVPGTADVNPNSVPAGAGNFGNTEIPGVRSATGSGFAFAPNFQLTAQNFPLHRRFQPTVFGDGKVNSTRVSMDTNDIVSSMGVKSVAGDPEFNWAQRNVRRVAGRNAQHVINAAFTYDQFWDGRGRFFFNGVSPIGFMDDAARVKRCPTFDVNGNCTGTIESVRVSIPYGQHASQSVGPPLSDREMSGHIRDWPAVGAKLLTAPGNVPLKKQLVSKTDSVLGPLANSPDNVNLLPGLNKTYNALIQEAFSPEWWAGTDAGVPVMVSNIQLLFGLAAEMYQNTLIADDTPLDRYLGSNLIPLAADRYKDANGNIPAGARPDPRALNAAQLRGLQVFQASLCTVCHILPMTSNATAFQLVVPPAGGAATGIIPLFVPPLASAFADIPGMITRKEILGTAPDALNAIRIVNNPNYRQNWLVPNLAVEAMLTPVAVPGQTLVGGLPLSVYDVGFYNIGRRPTEEDIGRGNAKPSGIPNVNIPLSYTEMSLMNLNGGLPASMKPFMPDLGILCTPTPPPPLVVPPGAVCLEIPNTPIAQVFQGAKITGSGPFGAINARTDVRGAFKVPLLRNVEFTGPYFHDGGDATLRHVVESYTRGGNFPTTNQLNFSVDMPPIPIMDVVGGRTATDRRNAERNIQDLVTFLSTALTDQRVARGLPPFDHPELWVPVGENRSTFQPETWQEVRTSGTGFNNTAATRFLNLNPQAR